MSDLKLIVLLAETIYTTDQFKSKLTADVSSEIPTVSEGFDVKKQKLIDKYGIVETTTGPQIDGVKVMYTDDLKSIKDENNKIIYGVKPPDNKITTAISAINSSDLGFNKIRLTDAGPHAPRFEINLSLTEQGGVITPLIYHWNGTGWENNDGSPGSHDDITEFFEVYKADKTINSKLSNEMVKKSITIKDNGYYDCFGTLIYANGDKWVTKKGGTEEVWWCKANQGVDDDTRGITFEELNGVIRHYQSFMLVKSDSITKSKFSEKITRDDCEIKKLEVCFNSDVNQTSNDLFYKLSNQTKITNGSLIDPKINNFTEINGVGVGDGPKNFTNLINELRSLTLGDKGYMESNKYVKSKLLYGARMSVRKSPFTEPMSE